MAGQYQGIVDYMKSQGQDWSKENRKMLFAQFFPGVEFTGTEDQNNLLMGKLKDPNNPLGTGAAGQGTDPTNPNAGNANKVVEQAVATADDKIQSFTVDEVQNATVTSSLGGQNIKPNDYAEGAGATGANSNTSNAVDFKAQKEVDDSKEELDKIKPPQTLFGMASKTLDKSGFTEGAGEFGDMAGEWGMEGLGKMGMDSGVMDNLKGAGQAATGFGGKMLGMAGSALSPLMAGMGNAMHGIGRGMMGIQMPRY